MILARSPMSRRLNQSSADMHDLVSTYRFGF